MFGNFTVDLIVVGNLKEKALRELEKEYQKRIKGYVKLNIIEIKDISNKYDEKSIKEREGHDILKVLDRDSYVIICDLTGKTLDSVEFADKLDHIITYEKSKITVIIGGSIGLSQEVLQEANMKLSFSKMTFPHQLFRIMLLEQLYRALRIKNNAPYHK